MGTFRGFGVSILFASSVFRAGAEGGAFSNTAECEQIAAHLRGDRDLVTGRSQERPIVALTRGLKPIVERATISDRGNGADAVQKSALEQRFQESFNPSDSLKKALHEILSDENDEIRSLPASSLHMVADTGGTAHCQTFLFFTAKKGARAKQVSNSPLDADRSDGDMSFCVDASGELARIAGTPGFIETRDVTTGFDSRLTLTQWRKGAWSPPCSVATHFLARYAVKKLYLSTNGGVSKTSLGAVAPGLARKFDDARDPNALSFGLIPPEAAAAAEKMKSLAETGEVQVPSFRAPASELEPYYGSIDRTHLYPLMLDGSLYLMRIGHATIGWRDFEDLVLIFYTLQADSLVPVATAIIDKSQGALASVTVRSGR